MNPFLALLISSLIDLAPLAWLGYQDYRYMSISDWDSFGALIVFIVSWLILFSLDWPAAVLSLLLAIMLIKPLQEICQRTMKKADLETILLLMPSAMPAASIALLVMNAYAIFNSARGKASYYPALWRLFVSFTIGVSITAFLLLR